MYITMLTAWWLLEVMFIMAIWTGVNLLFAWATGSTHMTMWWYDVAWTWIMICTGLQRAFTMLTSVMRQEIKRLENIAAAQETLKAHMAYVKRKQEEERNRGD
jgi:signal transduction histidine kinase